MAADPASSRRFLCFASKTTRRGCFMPQRSWGHCLRRYAIWSFRRLRPCPTKCRVWLWHGWKMPFALASGFSSDRAQAEPHALQIQQPTTERRWRNSGRTGKAAPTTEQTHLLVRRWLAAQSCPGFREMAGCDAGSRDRNARSPARRRTRPAGSLEARHLCRKLSRPRRRVCLSAAESCWMINKQVVYARKRGWVGRQLSRDFRRLVCYEVYPLNAHKNWARP